MYSLGNWKEAHWVLPQHQLLALVASTAFNILHAATNDDAWDSPPDLDNLPELAGQRTSLGLPLDSIDQHCGDCATRTSNVLLCGGI